MKLAARLSKIRTALRASRTTSRREVAALPAPLIVALEPRIVYDASAASIGAAAVAAPHHADAQAHAASVAREPGQNAGAAFGISAAASTHTASVSNSPPPTRAVHGYTPAVANETAAGTGDAPAMRAVQGFTDTPARATDAQVVFINSNVTDYQTLVAGLPQGTQVVILDSTKDGLTQIDQYLQQHPGVGAIHLVSHGADGNVQIGSTWLNQLDLSAHTAQLAQIGAAMKPGGDFLIYSCDVAENADGKALVQQIASITGLNVAASTDATGAAALGGDWVLEYDVGTVRTPVIFSQAAEQQYGELLVDPVQLTTDSGSAAFVAGDNTASTPVAIDSGITLSDTATGTLSTATVAITSGFAGGEDALEFTNQSNITGSYNPATGVLTLTSASATLAQWQSALQSVAYTDTAVTPNNVTRTISFTAVDSAGNTSATATRTVTVTDTDQTPIVRTTGGTTNYVGGTSATTIDGGVTVSDLDNTTQSSGTVSITSGFHSGDTLTFVNTSSATFGNIVGSYNSRTGVLTLTSSGAVASDAQWSNALSAVTFVAGSSAPSGNRTISFMTNDGTETSAAATDTVTVLGPPTITTDSGSAAFVAGDNVASTPVTIDSGLTITDGESPTLASATVAITQNFHSGEDILGFTNTSAATFGNISASYNAATGVLTLTSSGASATLAQWQAALDAVTYTDTAVTPNNATRTISFAAVDTSAVISNTATRTVTVADTDQTPIVTTTGGTTNYVGGTSAATIDGGVTVSDLDNTTQSSGTVSITSGFHSGDTLTFVNTSSATFGNIVGSYNSRTGVLTLTSSGATASDGQWSNALSAVTFLAGSSATSGNRTISFMTNDGTKTSAAATDTVDVLGPPTITTDSGSAAFVAGDNVAPTPVTIDSGLTVTDGEAPTFASATVAITQNFHSGEDILGFTNTSAATFGNIAASYNAATGVLTLTSSGASATLAQWQAALDAVTYTDTAVTPNSATRTMSFTATDAVAVTSNSATRTVTVTDTDQTPIVTTTGGTTNYVAGAPGVTIDSGIAISDRDNGTQASATVSITGNFHRGEDVLAFTNGNAATFGNIVGSYNAATGVLTLTSAGSTATDAQWANALSAVTLSSSGTHFGNRTISFATSDGTKTSAAAIDTVAVLDKPHVVTDSGSASFVAADGTTSTPIAVSPHLTLSDASSATLRSATVSITGGFHSGEDVLEFKNDGATMGNIAASYDATTGVMTLTSAGGTATLAQWQAALASITYTDMAVTPNTATRVVSFTVTDGNGAASDAQTRNVTVTSTHQTPSSTVGGNVTIVNQLQFPPILPPPATKIDSPATTTPSFAGSDATSPPAVLDEFDRPLPIGAVPLVRTMTFADPNAPAGTYSLSGTTVPRFNMAGFDAALAVAPAGSPPSPLPSVSFDMAPNDPFSISVATLLPPSEAMRGGSDITVQLADGRSLPGWIHFDAANGVLRGKLPPGVENVRIVIETRDASGHETRREIVLAPHDKHGGSHHHQRHVSHSKAPGHAALTETTRTVANAARPMGKPSLDQQFAQARAALHVSRPSEAARRV
ncbi:uncharacterized protein DUF4347 [Trinickia symbiotica]|uniref:DUF4347 domain-containing protein n=1 Tax=Trinickia symbiotica TaxID=863227 RepID=A0A2N7WRZ2_9BURK|nr:DUF4347 domain-containing protein [Trinickia symbiotica]PMS32180.1 DUF4347 domain-containing protein [Trinickia symbiotica]PPK41987.1 uncharacterized protein DUF4347 [Trinickia symbiotica]